MTMSRILKQQDILYSTFVLPGGMKVICRQLNSHAEYFGVAVNAGSRDENREEWGLAHFVEHTIFKGTHKRRSGHIINRMEAVGGELNAFTSKEETYVYSIFPGGNLSRAAELISDLILNSVFPAHEIDKERAVVEDEIDACLDTPADSVFDDFEDLFFAGSQLGHNILGNSATLRTLGPAECRSWLDRNYTAGRCTVFYVGPEQPAKVLRLIERYFSAIPAGDAPLRIVPEIVAPFRIRREAPSHQANTVVGARIGSLYSHDRFAMGLLVNILGGPGMNSRLNVALRERRGLVYSVEASVAQFTDCGLFTVYYGCDPEDNDRCLSLVLRELERASREPMTERALNAAKKQYLGQLLVASENTEQSGMNAARAMMYRGVAPSAGEISRAVMALTPGDILAAASLLVPEKCSSLTLG